jgi:hypothetical protein
MVAYRELWKVKTNRGNIHYVSLVESQNVLNAEVSIILTKIVQMMFHDEKLTLECAEYIGPEIYED